MVKASCLSSTLIKKGVVTAMSTPSILRLKNKEMNMYSINEGDVKGKAMESIKRAELIDEFYHRVRVLNQYDKTIQDMLYDRENHVSGMKKIVSDLERGINGNN
jgi:hypothetical protein